MQSAWVLPANSLATKYPVCKIHLTLAMVFAITVMDTIWQLADMMMEIVTSSMKSIMGAKLQIYLPMMLGDGICLNSSGLYNTEACKYDGGDCDEFNANYPG